MLGTVEGHAHVTAFEFLGGDWHCGRPWSPFGAPYALPASCAADEQGTNGAVRVVHRLRRRDRGRATCTAGRRSWTGRAPPRSPRRATTTPGIERAWKAGLRLMVTNLVDNEALCSLMTTRHNPCNDMDARQDPEPRPVRAPELHRRAVGRPGQGLVPDRHRSVPGPPGDQRGQARGDRGHRGVADLRLRRDQRRPAVQRRPDRRGAQGGPRRSACAPSSRSTSSTTRSAARR